jgi:hypothetical protein
MSEPQKPAIDMSARLARGKQALESNMSILSDDELMLVSNSTAVY